MIARRRSRRGAVLVVALVGLLVVVSLMASLITGTLVRHAHLRALHRVQQAELLVSAGRERAERRLAQASDYLGETWRPALGDAEDDPVATVDIQVRPDAGELRVVVTYPASQPSAVRRTGRFPLLAADPRSED